MTASLVLALSLILTSFLGSWHCAGMCGPIATLMAHRRSLLSYHLGRMIAYVSLGAVAGSLGQFFLTHDFIFLRIISGLFLGLILCVSGLNLLAPKFFGRLWSSHQVSQGLMRTIKKLQAFHIGHSGFVVGLLTAFLPCGWLYTYVAAAVATQSPATGAFTMFLFWLGGLPALSALPLMIRKGIAQAGAKQKKIAGLVLTFAGLYALASFFFLN